MINHRFAANIITSFGYRQITNGFIQLSLIILTTILFYPALLWMFDALLTQEHRFQLMGILILLGALFYKLTTHRDASVWPPKPQFRFIPVALFISCIIGFLINEYFVDIHILSAVMSILAFYGLFGFYCSNDSWQKALLPTLLLIVLLPFGDYLDVYFGFPLRLFTAYISSDILSALTFSSVSSDTIIIIENQTANVDLSCSGIKGLWSGLAFFVLLSWIEGKRINFSWFWRLLVFFAVLISANIVRVTCLVLLGTGFSNMQLANLVHESLGIISFAIACIFGWGILLTLKQTPASVTPLRLTKSGASTNLLPKSTFVILLLIVSISNMLYTPMPKSNTTQVNINLNLPEHWAPKATPLSTQEQQFFNHNQAEAQKFHFQLNDTLEGSLIAVHSTYWKGQHDPKNCHISQGYKIIDDATLRLSTTESVRYMKLMRDEKPYIAIYWFQNSSQLTDDYSKRLFSGVLRKDESWVLASLLLETPTPKTLKIQELVYPIKKTIDNQLMRAIQHEI